MALTVKKVAALTGLTVRALHHYDHLGLLRPAGTSAAGYRLYDEDDLARLQQVMFFRELGFGLSEIRDILDRPGFDRREALVAHRRLLLEERKRLDRLIVSVEHTLESIEGGTHMADEELFEGFSRKQAEEYRQEARARWGESVDESYARTSKYSKEDWNEIQAESGEIYQGLADRMDRDPADPGVQAFIERHHRHISERFYECPTEQYRCLGDLYVDDPRFTANYDKMRPGLAVFVRAAIQVFCDRAAKK